MTLLEVKEYLRVDGTEEDALISGLHLASEKYLENGGVNKDYSNDLYKLAVLLLTSHWYENRQLEQVGNHVARMSLSLDTLINQLRYSQEVI